MNTHTTGSSRRSAGMPPWLHRLTATVGALAIGLLTAFVIVVGSSRPTEAIPTVPETTGMPSGDFTRCGQHSDKAERHWCLALWTASTPVTKRAGL